MIILLALIFVAGVVALVYYFWPSKKAAPAVDDSADSDDTPQTKTAKKKKAAGIDAVGSQKQPVPAEPMPYGPPQRGNYGPTWDNPEPAVDKAAAQADKVVNYLGGKLGFLWGDK